MPLTVAPGLGAPPAPFPPPLILGLAVGKLLGVTVDCVAEAVEFPFEPEPDALADEPDGDAEPDAELDGEAEPLCVALPEFDDDEVEDWEVGLVCKPAKEG
jgi:hypothetical protein